MKEKGRTQKGPERWNTQGERSQMPHKTISTLIIARARKERKMNGGIWNGATKRTADTVIAQVHETWNYDSFRKLQANRIVGEDRKEKIMASIREGDVLNPIVVNEKKRSLTGKAGLKPARNLAFPSNMSLQKAAVLMSVGE